ncbi:hypothetical protein MPTK1_5g03390 [Marchantia polymorpha subsp. ruderalis]|uniref:Uncharacterized protein n=2 Tax=Marchantia polymorpha TaxID=3197 RepID=A0AAF6BEI2_MARPO|nr:hypothetical protein MARPO_0133s0048 [Marchantia polymorpha]BBN10416.1 hypothetical protein Mp_5g03390 [Marchantia polymorpha subsp. ruderalis]|eukprot:PTQ29907.1 hypothetical protein MARPO_0133s0048 [Marchantia polymorpha]
MFFVGPQGQWNYTPNNGSSTVLYDAKLALHRLPRSWTTCTRILYYTQSCTVLCALDFMYIVHFLPCFRSQSATSILGLISASVLGPMTCTFLEGRKG